MVKLACRGGGGGGGGHCIRQWPVNWTECQCQAYLPEATFLLHVLLDGLPNAALGDEGAPGGQLKLFVAAVSLQG